MRLFINKSLLRIQDDKSNKFVKKIFVQDNINTLQIASSNKRVNEQASERTDRQKIYIVLG